MTLSHLDFLSFSNILFSAFLVMMVAFPSIILGAILFWLLNKNYLPREFRKEREEMIYRAQKEAEKIKERAEMEALKILAGMKFEVKKIEKEFFEKINEILKESKENLSKEIKITKEKFSQFVGSLEKDSLILQKELKEKAKRAFDDFEKELKSNLKDIKEKIKELLEKEKKEYKKELEKYKKEQMDAIKENIVEIVERTISEVLSKKLSLKDHIEMVFKALEKAQREKFFNF